MFNVTHKQVLLGGENLIDIRRLFNWSLQKFYQHNISGLNPYNPVFGFDSLLHRNDFETINHDLFSQLPGQE